MQNSELLGLAKGAAKNAHCPYSRFAVGAAVLWCDGSTSVGVNVENASYPLGVCAERNAIAAGICAGGKKVVTVAVWAAVDESVSPCGGCRQVIHEFAAGPSTQVLMGGNGDAKTSTISELLPLAFDTSSLKND
ncbi:MAG: cytidine deaminase [Planctomycetota bacterium]|jgi:cytidine deaminase|nr:cytidine deaminase [Planctomycetota bacterium]